MGKNLSRVYKLIATSVTAFVIALVGMLPANAHDTGHKIDTVEPFRHTGEPANWVAIAIVMVVLFAVILITATIISNRFVKKVR